MFYIISITICSLLIIAGLAGILIPGLPSLPLIFLGILIYAAFTHFTTITLSTIIFFAFLTLLATGLSYVAGLIGAKKLGATRYGLWGGLIGLLIGLIFSPFGLFSIILGPLLGTIIGEMIGGKQALESSKIGLGTLVGYLAAIIIDLIIAGWMIFIFLKAVF